MASSKKRRRGKNRGRHGSGLVSARDCSDSEEPRLRAFSRSYPPLQKSVVLDTMAFLQNDDLYNASLVSSLWSRLAFDQALWSSTWS
ncbi:unnamed protein product [Discosporangium mesarthrocarpum]